MIWWNPPLQGHNLGALHLDYFDLLASLALTVICQSFYNARSRWLPALVGLLAGFSSFFDLLILDKSSSVLLFLVGRLVGTSICLLHDCHIMATIVFLAAGGGEELLFRVVVKRGVLMMLWWSGSSSSCW